MKRTLLFLSVALLFTATSDAERINFGWEINEVTAYREMSDINWMTTGKYSECYNFAGGDPSMIWAAFGYLGRSKNLIQTLEGNPADPNAYTYLTTCKTVSADHVEVKEYQTQSAKLTAVRNYDIRLRK